MNKEKRDKLIEGIVNKRQTHAELIRKQFSDSYIGYLNDFPRRKLLLMIELNELLFFVTGRIFLKLFEMKTMVAFALSLNCVTILLLLRKQFENDFFIVVKMSAITCLRKKVYTKRSGSLTVSFKQQGSHRNSKTQFHDFSMINNVISISIISINAWPPTSPISDIFTMLSINVECSNSNVFK